MLIVTLIIAAGWAATIAAFVRYLASRDRGQARERDLLVNQILHLSGRTWTPPPAEQWQPPAPGEPLVREWTATPEQYPFE